MDTPNKIDSAEPASAEALLKVYEEICKSYHDIDDFRTKLLGFLPLSSLIGIFGLSNTSFVDKSISIPHLITFIGVFAATFTLALFIYEIRGILRCNDLIKRGSAIEHLLNVEGQFFVCVKEFEFKESKRWIERTTSFFDAKLAACIIYSTVFAAWIFMVLRVGFEISIYGCVFSAVFVGLLIGGSIFFLVKKLIAA